MSVQYFTVDNSIHLHQFPSVIQDTVTSCLKAAATAYHRVWDLDEVHTIHLVDRDNNRVASGRVKITVRVTTEVVDYYDY